MDKKIVIALVAGQALGLLGWIDPLFFPFMLIGPLVVGAVAAARRVPLVPVMALWVSAGLCLLWTDWLGNREDVAFHAVAAVVMAGLAAVGWGIVTGLATFTQRRGSVPMTDR
jgi:hypothetical protein